MRVVRGSSPPRGRIGAGEDRAGRRWLGRFPGPAGFALPRTNVLLPCLPVKQFSNGFSVSLQRPARRRKAVRSHSRWGIADTVPSHADFRRMPLERGGRFVVRSLIDNYARRNDLVCFRCPSGTNAPPCVDFRSSARTPDKADRATRRRPVAGASVAAAAAPTGPARALSSASHSADTAMCLCRTVHREAS